MGGEVSTTKSDGMWSFAHPCAVKVDEQYRIAVLDHTRGRIQVYTKSKDPVLV